MLLVRWFCQVALSNSSMVSLDAIIFLVSVFPVLYFQLFSLAL